MAAVGQDLPLELVDEPLGGGADVTLPGPAMHSAA